MKGQKTGGRVAGTPNKVTRELRNILKGIIGREFEALPTTIKQLPPKERIELLVKLLPFCMPKIDTIGGSYDSGWNIDDD